MPEPQIYIVNVAAEHSDLRVLLSDEERRRADRFRFDDDRRRYTVAHGRLRQIVGERVGRDPAALQFGSGAHGKPFLCDGGVEFSYSHSGDVVLIAIADVAVGADVERVAPRAGLEAIARRSFTAAEQAWLRGQRDATRAFFRIWTMKEAALKGDGAGISLGLREAAVDIDAFDRVFVRGAAWSAREVEAGEDYCAVVAVPA